MRVIGQSIKRLEDPPLLTGRGRFVADLSFPGTLHMRVVRSRVAFGRLRAIATGEARRHPGAVAVWTAADVTDIPPIDFRMTPVASLPPYRQPVLAREYVRYVGEPIALVFAANPYLAEDIAEMVVADIEPLEPCLDPTGAIGTFAPGLPGEPATVKKSYGDVEGALRAAHKVVTIEVSVARHSAVPLETRGAIAIVEPSGILRLYGAAKVPHYNRQAIAKMLGLALDRIHLSEGHVGGGFGVRGELYPEDVLACVAALRMKRPIKWIEDRYEHLMTANQSRGQTHRLRAGVDERGFILGLDDEFWLDQGAYVRTHGVTVSDLTAAMLPGPYVIPAYRSVGHVRLTNKTPCGTYRAPGRFEGTFARERLLDAIAESLGLDTIAVRRVNLIPKDALPFHRPFAAIGTEMVYDSGDYAGMLDKTLAWLDWDKLRRDIEDRRRNGELVGLGLGYFVEKSGLGPFEDVRIELHDTGLVEVITGAASLGQGVETAMAQICADHLGVAMDRIRVIHGQTDRIARGMGAFASRVTVMAGTAVTMAAAKLRTTLLAKAAELLQARPDQLEIRDGRVVRGDDSGPSIAFEAVAGASGGKIEAEATFAIDHMTYPYGIHVALVRVDRETCGVHIERYFVAYDIGKAINPMLIEGQIVGGVAQGIGGTLMEEFAYDESGQPLAVTFADYLMPTMTEMPEVKVLLLEDAPTPLNPLGVKGAGEAGINASGAAIAAAVDDAIGRPGAIRQLPITPRRLHAILHGAPDPL